VTTSPSKADALSLATSPSHRASSSEVRPWAARLAAGATRQTTSASSKAARAAPADVCGDGSADGAATTAAPIALRRSIWAALAGWRLPTTISSRRAAVQGVGDRRAAAAARVLAEEIRSALEHLSLAIGRAKGRTSQAAPLTISCEPTFLIRWLIPRLSGLQDALGPDREIRLTSAGGARRAHVG
jgi:hypothetical protein